MSTLYEKLKKYEVKAASLREFCDLYHRRGAYHDRGEDYMQFDYEDHKKELERDGYTIIPPFSSATGFLVSYYGKI